MSARKIEISNDEIYKLIKTGKTRKSISEITGLSCQRISQIYRQEKYLEEHPLDDLRKLCNEYSDSKNLSTIVYNGLKRGCRYYDIPKILTVDDLRNLPMEKIPHIRNIGEKAVAVIWNMKMALESEEILV
jgi:DNA-directed RNA polymerase alpha subunit